MSQPSDQPQRPPAPHNPSSDRVAWISMVIVALMGALVLGWAASLTAG